MNYEQALTSLEKLEVHGIFLGLDRIRQLLKKLGDPHNQFSSIHIAGTNGKGSTASYLSSVLKEGGYRTGLYTSPHLIQFTERISISGTEIPPDKVVHYTEKIFSIIETEGEDFQPTYFEVTTAMAFAYFAEQQVEVAIIETGLGGRLDATNVVTPLLSVITNVALEHTEYLGDTVGQIAREKGGIIKKGVEVITGEKNTAALEVLQDICDKEGCRILIADQDFQAESITQYRTEGKRTFNYRGVDSHWDGMIISLLGVYQIRNAMLALAVLERLIHQGLDLDEGVIRRGLACARWPGRMEVISRNPYLILDGAHNPHAAEALRKTLEEDLDYKQLILVIGILQDKDIPAVVNPLLPYASHLVLTRPEYYRGSDPHVLSKNIQKDGLVIEVEETIPGAIELALRLYREGDLILVTGSLYTVGEAREYLLDMKKRRND